ncbi:MAG: V-type ATP synthase subunit D, partial [Deinococcota bacterium]
MAQLAMNKSELQKQRRQLALYERLLPSLELKRQQLRAEAAKAERELRRLEHDLSSLKQDTARAIPMLAASDLDLSGLVQLKNVHIQDDNVVGVRVPALVNVDLELASYGFLARPHWVDVWQARLQEMVRLEVAINVARVRHARLEQAVKRTTQRVNLFDKVLIPNAQETIRRIQIFLADADRAAVVRAKLAKQ